MGKLIVFEGVDGSGKSTQYRRLCRRLRDEGRDFRSLVFPQYEEPSSALIRMYLAGEFGDKPSDVNAYAASAFFAVDRYASYKKSWGAYYEAGGLIVTDRYTTSNAVHQASKLPAEQRSDYLRWLFDFEYDKLGLPAPDLVLFCDVDLSVSVEHLRHRESETNTRADIHERDEGYLGASIEAARQAAGLCAWHRLDCGAAGALRSVEEIGAEVDRAVEELCRI
ncbi:MAG: thymidylate kinase [Oscillospiraceae bacterium]|nr:thymidylate kinase [Oscillospiraceae bacterium]